MSKIKKFFITMSGMIGLAFLKLEKVLGISIPSGAEMYGVTTPQTEKSNIPIILTGVVVMCVIFPIIVIIGVNAYLKRPNKKQQNTNKNQQDNQNNDLNK